MQTYKFVQIDSKIASVIRKYVTKTNKKGVFEISAAEFGGVSATEWLYQYSNELSRFAKVNGTKFNFTNAKYGAFGSSKTFTFKVSDVLVLDVITELAK